MSKEELDKIRRMQSLCEFIAREQVALKDKQYEVSKLANALDNAQQALKILALEMCRTEINKEGQ